MWATYAQLVARGSNGEDESDDVEHVNHAQHLVGLAVDHRGRLDVVLGQDLTTYTAYTTVRHIESPLARQVVAGAELHLHGLLHSVFRVEGDDGLGGNHVADLGVVQDIISGVLLHDGRSRLQASGLLAV